MSGYNDIPDYIRKTIQNEFVQAVRNSKTAKSIENNAINTANNAVNYLKNQGSQAWNWLTNNNGSGSEYGSGYGSGSGSTNRTALILGGGGSLTDEEWMLLTGGVGSLSGLGSGYGSSCGSGSGWDCSTAFGFNSSSFNFSYGGFSGSVSLGYDVSYNGGVDFSFENIKFTGKYNMSSYYASYGLDNNTVGAGYSYGGFNANGSWNTSNGNINLNAGWSTSGNGWNLGVNGNYNNNTGTNVLCTFSMTL